MNSTPPRKINRISFLDQGFSIGDSELNAPGSSIQRSHWKPQSSATKCKLCDKTLSVKNGIVNCRKCGDLFCNDHTHYKVRLRNPNKDEKIPQYDSSGVWCRCCETCYFDKQHVEINSIDLTQEFKLSRQSKVEPEQLNRTKIQRNFIKLTNLLTEKSSVDNIVNWSPDSSNCSICFVKFNLFIRRHHCRLCGSVVCDDPEGIRKGCSMNVPLVRIVEKLPKLNYQRKPLEDEQIKFRCCVNCKNALLFDWKRDTDTYNPIFGIYDSMLLQKQQIERIIPQFEALVKDTKEPLKLRTKLVQCLKDLEDSLYQFRNQFYYKEGEILLVQLEYTAYDKLITNIYQSMAVFLQDNLVKYKQIADTYKQNSPAPPTPPPPPRLTKKQIREMREQLMVMNEQKFLVEKLIKDYTKQRRFDELDTLISNKTELEETIKSLEEELGEFGF